MILKREKLRQKKINKSSRADLYLLVIALIIIVPLIFSRKTLDPNLAPRMLFWGVVILILSILIAGKSLKKKQDFGFIKLLVFPVYLLYFLLTILSLTQAINPAEGIYDISKTFLSLMLLIIATHVFNQHDDFKIILVKSVILTSIFATGLGLYQYLNFTAGKSGYEFFQALYHIKGLMAHKNQFAISLFLMVPFSIYGIFELKKGWRYLSIFSVVTLLVNIILIQTRSVWIALLMFIVVLTITSIIAAPDNKIFRFSVFNKRLLTSVSAFFAVVIIVYFVFQKSEAGKLFKYQTQTIFDFQSDNNKGRIDMWESTWQMCTNHFPLGVGAGNWKIAVLPYYSLNFGSRYQNWRRPHNDYLWVLSEKGIFGLLCYILIFIFIAIYGIKILYKKPGKENVLYTKLMLSAIAGYLIIAFFTFPYERISHQIFLTLIMAGIISIYYKSILIQKQVNRFVTAKGSFLIIILIGLTVFYSAALLKSEIYINKILDKKTNNDWKKIIYYADKAYSPLTTLDPNSIPIHLYRGKANLQLKKIGDALNDFKIAYNYHPTLITSTNNLGSVYSMMGQHEKAITLLNSSLAVFPHRETTIINLAYVYFSAGNYTKAYTTLLCCSTDSKNPDITRLMKKIKSKID